MLGTYIKGFAVLVSKFSLNRAKRLHNSPSPTSTCTHVGRMRMVLAKLVNLVEKKISGFR